MTRKIFLSFSLLLSSIFLRAQLTFPTNGAPFRVHTTYAYINANIFTDADNFIKRGVLLFKDGRIITIAEKADIPKDAFVVDLQGKYIYPAFIDIYSDYGVPEAKPATRHREGPQMESNAKGAYGWNQAIKADAEAYKVFIHNNERAESLRKLGFGSVVSCTKDGIVRGSAVLVNLNHHSKENLSVLNDRCAAFYSLNKGSSSQDYPSSLTGCIALLRQTYYDAQWYKNNGREKEFNISLEAFNRLQELPSVIDGNDKFNDLRAAKIGQEFNIKYIIKGGGNEYQRISEIQATGLRYILPLNFPDAYEVDDPFDTENITLAELKHWELAPGNPSAFEKNNIPFCFTAADLKNRDEFLKNIRKAVHYGLSEKAALKALTTNPAQFINASDKIGSLKKNYYANFFVCNKPIFEEDATVMQSVVNGEFENFTDLNPPDIRGNYTLNAGNKSYALKLSGDALKPAGEIKVDTSKKTFHYTFSNNLMSFHFSTDSANTLRGSGSYDEKNKSFSGKVQNSNGNWVSFTISYKSAVDTASKKQTPKKQDLNLGKIVYPFTAYGEPLPESKGTFKDAWNKYKGRHGALLIKNATVWTNSGDTVLKETDVYVADGKIARVGPNIDAAKLGAVKVIDAKGMHLTPGIIDEHSHIALTGGVNEGAQASSAEVRMGDVINPEDINIYRQLAGGVTCSQLLHGSANPIGGQSGLIKLRWGHSAEDMKYEKADGFIKFALGENVKQSNWGDNANQRFPQSRMGVEQVYNDFFTRAKEYNKQWSEYNKLDAKLKGKSPAPLRDLELEAIAEILNGKRFITCHSYVQSEINMLMHLADSFGFKVNTFTHILEGYKVADKMKKHGVNASTFADWWAYKNEVMEAIPYNAAILTKMGVNTSVNSDDAEMARRLNQEAAKSVKYGGLTETEALKLVTLNPARMLHIDDKVGSVKVGKTADLVLWTDNPLSIYAKADKTIIDGQIYFDREEDAKLKEYIKNERARLTAKMLAEKQKGARTTKHQPKNQRLYHCNTLEGISEEGAELR